MLFYLSISKFCGLISQNGKGFLEPPCEGETSLGATTQRHSTINLDVNCQCGPGTGLLELGNHWLLMLLNLHATLWNAKYTFTPDSYK